jgi:SAM-dependent methyltransferase
MGELSGDNGISSLGAVPWAEYRRLSTCPPTVPLDQPSCCPLCGADDPREIFRVDDFQFFEDRDGTNRVTHRVVACLHCGMMYRNPWYSPEGIARLFEKAGISYGHCDGRERSEWIQEHVQQSGRVLDIGCGDGAFLRALPSEFQCTGIDVDGYLIRRARERSPGISFLQADWTRGQSGFDFDLITLFHILEHLPNPVSALRRIRTEAKKGTRLIVEVPVIDRAQEVQGEDVSGFFSLPHFSNFSKRTLHHMLELGGWKVQFKQDIPGYNGYRIMAQLADPETPSLLENQADRDRETVRIYLDRREQSIRRICEQIARIPAGRNILVWGAGHHTEYLDRYTSLFDTRLRYLIVDCDPLKKGTHYHSIPVLHPDRLPPLFWNSNQFQVVVSSFIWNTQICEILSGKGVPADSVTAFYPRSVG